MFQFRENRKITWFTRLNKSRLNPPDKVFSIVWPILYIMIVISFIVYLFQHSFHDPTGILLFVFQIVFNLAWPFLFFQKHWIGWALVDLIFLWIFLGSTIIWFFHVQSEIAAILLLPYFLWTSFAFYLNLFIYLNN